MQAAVALSSQPDAPSAVAEALASLRDRLGDGASSLSLLFVYATTHHAPTELARSLARLAPNTPAVGGTSCQGLMSAAGIHGLATPALGVLALSDPDGDYGVGATPQGDDAEAAARCALDRALDQAGRPGEVPELIWICVAPGVEEAVLRAIDDRLGGAVPIFGGSSADDDVAGTWCQLTTGAAGSDLIIVAVLFSSEPLSAVFNSGYEPLGPRASVDAVAGRSLLRLGGRPAGAVYDEWTGGLLSDLAGTGGNVLGRTTLQPLGEEFGDLGGTPFYRLLHPATLQADGALDLFAEVAPQRVLHAMQGDLEALLERPGRTAVSALRLLELRPEDVAAALVVYCAGCRLAVGERLVEVADALRDALPGVPFLGFFSFGEQGCTPQGKNLHGNLMFSVLLFPRGL